MPEPRQCAECGASLPSGAPNCLCPTCGFRAALKADPQAAAPFYPSALFDPPSAGRPLSADAVGDSPSACYPRPSDWRGAGGEGKGSVEGRGEGEPEIQNPKSQIQNPRIRYFGDYELLEEIARGGMGVVYRARQVSLNRTVAVKMILAGQLASASDVQRFCAEAEAAAKLQHPNIVAIHEVGEHDGQHYFSMDFVEGKNLAQLVSDFGFRIPEFRRAARWMKTIAEAIHYAHQRGVLHRDLKPSNVLIDPTDQPRITDFGVAKRLDVAQASSPASSGGVPPAHSEPGRGRPENPQAETPALHNLTLTGQVLGSPNFMPPEQAAGKRGQIGPQIDVYSLGAILYHLLTARPPFLAETLTETLQQVQNADPIS